MFTLTDETVVRTDESRIQLSRLILAVQTAVKVTAAELRHPGPRQTVNKVWLDHLVRSHALRYIVTSTAQVYYHTVNYLK